jgi:hypothetical protein
MSMKQTFYRSVAVIGLAGLLGAAPAQLNAQSTIAINSDDIGGVVTGPNGPEAGIWVIAETTDLGTKFAKMVVTDDQGRYVVPDLPKAKYKIWVRGYGLVDSTKVDGEPGKILNLAAVKAPTAAAAAEYYPAIYWFSMIKAPDQASFPGTGPDGNGINPGMKSQGQFLDLVKTNGCVTCHQLGNKARRTIPEALGKFANGYEAWTRRIQSGQAATNMVNTIERMGAQAALKIFGEWTDPRRGRRIAGGEAAAPPRGRAQCGHHGVGLVEPEGVPARCNGERQAQSHGERQWPGLWCDRELDRQSAGARSAQERRVRSEAAGARSEDSVRERGPDVRAFAVFRGREDLGRPDQSAQPVLRREGTGLVCRQDSSAGQSGLLQEGLRSSVGEGVPARIVGPPDHDV